MVLFPSDDKLNWTVRDEQVQTASGIVVPGYKAIVREDTSKVLSIMGKDYTAYQNSELIELLNRVSNQTGLEIKRSGSFGDGERVYIQLKSNDLKMGNDRVEGYLTGINSFDGSTSLAFGPTNVTISCGNTFNLAFKEMSSKVRHTKNMGIKIDDICRGLEGLLIEEKKVFDTIIKMSETPYNDMLKEKVTRELFNIDKSINLNDKDNISTQTQNKLSQFYVDLNGEISGKGQNLWGLFSGITKYSSHHLYKDGRDSTEAKMFGSIAKKERSIFSELAELV